MGRLLALVLILLQAPPAIIRGRFDVDHRYSVYGLPARLVGVLLLQLVVLVVADVVSEMVLGKKNWPGWYLLLRIASFLGGITGAALICALFREKRRDFFD